MSKRDNGLPPDAPPVDVADAPPVVPDVVGASILKGAMLTDVTHRTAAIKELQALAFELMIDIREAQKRLDGIEQQIRVRVASLQQVERLIEQL